jgi:hypothetical protein
LQACAIHSGWTAGPSWPASESITYRWEFDLMTFKKNLISALGAAALLGAMSSARADADILGAELFATGGDITVRFEGSSAGYDSLISVNGGPQIFPNHTTGFGTEVNLGNFAAGTALDVVLHVLTTGLQFHSGAGALNIDAMPHALVNQTAGRTYVSFEDIAGGGDKDYNDHKFSFTNVSVTAVPEASTVAMMLAGLGVLGFLGTRRRKD